MNAIEFENISKQYRLGYVNSKTLSQDLNRWWTMNILRKEDPLLKIGETNDRTSKGESEYVWALKNIDFKVEQGDVVGIIGKNGAGKSTLLKLLSRVTNPTTGIIRARGKIASLLEVGTGFHPELTGRENIYMNGAIMGMTKQEINSKLDEIVDFSGCERYIDTPVKRYSSGMMVRLGFAVAAHLEPEILVVDEVLAVGDAEFQKKAIGKMQDVSKGDGRTVLFVSHNMASVKSLCKNGILLENGSVKFVSAIEDVITEYLQGVDMDLCGSSIIEKSHHIYGDALELEYLEVKMLNNISEVSSEEPLHFEMIIKRSNKKLLDCQFGIVIRNMDDVVIGACYSDVVNLPNEGDIFKIEYFLFNHRLAKGRYKLNFNISRFDYSAAVRDYDVVQNVIRFDVTHIDLLHSQPFTYWSFKGSVCYNEAKVIVVKNYS